MEVTKWRRVPARTNRFGDNAQRMIAAQLLPPQTIPLPQVAALEPLAERQQLVLRKAVDPECEAHSQVNHGAQDHQSRDDTGPDGAASTGRPANAVLR